MRRSIAVQPPAVRIDATPWPTAIIESPSIRTPPHSGSPHSSASGSDHRRSEPGDQWGPQKRSHDGAIAWAFLGEVTAKRDVPLRRDAHAKADVVHRLKAGDKVQIVGTQVAANRVRWAMIEYAPGKVGRALLSAFEPDRWPTV